MPLEEIFKNMETRSDVENAVLSVFNDGEGLIEPQVYNRLFTQKYKREEIEEELDRRETGTHYFRGENVHICFLPNDVEVTYLDREQKFVKASGVKSPNGTVTAYSAMSLTITAMEYKGLIKSPKTKWLPECGAFAVIMYKTTPKEKEEILCRIKHWEIDTQMKSPWPTS